MCSTVTGKVAFNYSDHAAQTVSLSLVENAQNKAFVTSLSNSDTHPFPYHVRPQNQMESVLGSVGWSDSWPRRRRRRVARLKLGAGRRSSRNKLAGVGKGCELEKGLGSIVWVALKRWQRGRLATGWTHRTTSRNQPGMTKLMPDTLFQMPNTSHTSTLYQIPNTVSQVQNTKGLAEPSVQSNE